MTILSPKLAHLGTIAPSMKTMLCRRTMMTGAVASAFVATPIVAAPPVAGITPHPDAALVELGAHFDAALAAYLAAYDDWRRRHAAFDAFVTARAPKTLRWRWKIDKGMPFTVMHSRWHEGDLYEDADVEYIRSRRWDDIAKYASGITGRRAQARADQIVAAADRWRSERDARMAELQISSEDDKRLEELDGSVMDLLHEIATAPAAQTTEGVAVKARSVLYQIELGFDQAEDAADLCEEILRVAGVDPKPFKHPKKA